MNSFSQPIQEPAKLTHDFKVSLAEPQELHLKSFSGGYLCMGFYAERLQLVQLADGKEKVLVESFPKNPPAHAPVKVQLDKGDFAFRLRIETTAECRDGIVQCTVAKSGV